MSASRGTGRRVVLGIAGAAVLIGALTALARVVGFVRVLAFSGSVGAGCTGTAYAAANQVPNVLFEVVAGGALAGAVVPLVASGLARGRPDEADRTASALLTWAVVVTAPLAVLIALLAGPVASALLAGDDTAACPGAAAVGARMLVVFAPQVVLYAVGVVLAGVLQAHRRFAAPALAPLLSSLVVIAAYLAYARLTRDGGTPGAEDGTDPGRAAELVLAGGTTLGVAVLSLPLFVPVLRTRTRLRATLRFPEGVAPRARALALAGVATLLAQQAAVVVTLVLAARAPVPGVLNAVQYAQAVYLLPYAVLAVPLATAAFPRLSEQAALGDTAAFARTAAASTRAVVLVSVLGAAVLVAVAPAVQQFFVALDREPGPPVRALGASVVAFALGLPGWGLVAVVGRALYAVGAGRAAALATSAGWGAVVLAALVAVPVLAATERGAAWGTVVGLSVANSGGMTLAGALLVGVLRRSGGAAATSGLARTAAVVAAVAVPATVAGRLLADRLGGGAPAGGTGGGTGSAVLAGLGGGVVVLAVGALLLRAADPGQLALFRRGPVGEAGP